jgi:hypothetical protein
MSRLYSQDSKRWVIFQFSFPHWLGVHTNDQGDSRDAVDRAPQTHCIRPTCILRYVSLCTGIVVGLMKREKKKIIMKDGDAEEFYVEKYIGYVPLYLTHQGIRLETDYQTESSGQKT